MWAFFIEFHFVIFEFLIKLNIVNTLKGAYKYTDGRQTYGSYTFKSEYFTCRVYDKKLFKCMANQNNNDTCTDRFMLHMCIFKK